MKHSFALMGMLVVALAVFGYYAIAPNPLTISIEYRPRQVNLSPYIDTSIFSPQDTVLESVDTVAVEKVDSSMLRDTSSQRILLFGDSMTALLGNRLKQYATGNGHELTTVCWYSSTTYVWATDTLNYYLNKVNPTHVFICLGSNQLFTKNLETVDKHIGIILDKIGKVPVIWIGPPNWKADNGFNDVVLKRMGPTRYYPSLNLVLNRASDGRHPTNKAGADWMDSVVVWMNKGNSVHPFVLDSIATTGKQNLILLKPPK